MSIWETDEMSITENTQIKYHTFVKFGVEIFLSNEVNLTLTVYRSSARYFCPPQSTVFIDQTIVNIWDI